jgi:LysM repeat protein
LFSSPGHFGIKKKKWSYYPQIPYKVYKVDTAITNLAAFAKHIGCSKAIIKFFNPWLLQDVLPKTEGKTYEIRIPKNLNADYSSYIRDLTGQDGSLNQDPEEAPDTTTKPVKDTTQVSAKIIYHVVKEKETLDELAGFYEVKTENLRKWNDLKDKQEAAVGQTLSIHY